MSRNYQSCHVISTTWWPKQVMSHHTYQSRRTASYLWHVTQLLISGLVKVSQVKKIHEWRDVTLLLSCGLPKASHAMKSISHVMKSMRHPDACRTYNRQTHQHTNTRTHTHNHTYTHTHTHTHTHTLHTYTHTQCGGTPRVWIKLSLVHTHTCTHTRTHPHVSQRVSTC